jgi:hypothetical protein
LGWLRDGQPHPQEKSGRAGRPEMAQPARRPARPHKHGQKARPRQGSGIRDRGSGIGDQGSGKRVSTETTETTETTEREARNHAVAPPRKKGSGIGDRETIIHGGHRTHRLGWLRDGQPHPQEKSGRAGRPEMAQPARRPARPHKHGQKARPSQGLGIRDRRLGLSIRKNDDPPSTPNTPTTTTRAG